MGTTGEGVRQAAGRLFGRLQYCAMPGSGPNGWPMVGAGIVGRDLFDRFAFGGAEAPQSAVFQDAMSAAASLGEMESDTIERTS